MTNMPDFTTDEYELYRVPIGEKNRPIVYTGGVRNMAEQLAAHWLIDVIASYQIEEPCRSMPFQAWTLRVDLKAETGVVTCQDGDEVEMQRQDFWFTTFSLPEMTLWAEHSWQSDDGVGELQLVTTISLPEEH